MRGKRRTCRRPLQAAIGMLALATIALGLVFLPGPAGADPGEGAAAAQDAGQICAVFDSADGSLTFERVAGEHADGDEDGTLTYYTGFEETEYSFITKPSWLAHAADIKAVDFQAAVSPRRCAYWFYNCGNLEEVRNAGRLDVSGVSSMNGMFAFCQSLASLDVSKWDTSNVENVSSMFSGCSSLSSLDVSKWDTSKIWDMNGMFFECSKLDFLDFSGWYTARVDGMLDMFEGCSSLSSVRLGSGFSFKTSNLTYAAVLPNAPDNLGHEGKWVNESKPDAQGVTAAELRDNYPDTTNPSYAPGTYAWEGTTKAAVFDSAEGSLTFKREPDPHTDGQEVGTKIYYTGFEDKEYSYGLQPSWLAHASGIKKVDFQTAVAPMSCAHWFDSCKNLEEVRGAGRLDTSAVTDMSCMFVDCWSLVSLDVSGWDTSSVTNMYFMFTFCHSLASLDVSGWDTSRVTNMSQMFAGCSELSSLDVSGWDTSKARNMNRMLDGCTSLSSVTLGGEFSFRGAVSNPQDYAVLPDAPDDDAHTGRWINESAPGASGVTAAELRDGYPDAANPSYAPGTYAWEAATKAAVFDSADGSLTFERVAGTHSGGQVVGTLTYHTGFEDKEYSLNVRPSWLVHASGIKKVDFQTAVAPMSCAHWFDGCKNLEEVRNAGRLDVSGSASMRDLFAGCSSLSSLDLSGWDTSKVEDMNGMFYHCSSLSSLGLSGWDTSKVEDMNAMFRGCASLASLDLSGWDTSSVRDMSHMFSLCPSLASLDVSGWGTSKVEDMTDMFSGCSALSSVKLGGEFSFKTPVPGFSAVLPDAPDGGANTGRWINSSEPGASGVTAEELRDRYPDAANPSYAPGTYVWEGAIDLSAAEVSVPDQVYTGKALTPAPTVALDGKTLAAGTDYDVSYKDNVNVGTATVTVIGRGVYSGSAKATFKIELGRTKALTFGRTKTESIEVSWARVAGAKGYRVQWRKHGGKWKSVSTKSTGTTVEGLKKGGLYDLRVRAVAGKAEGAWSAQTHRWLRGQAGVRATSKKSGTVKVSWKKTAKANAGYLVVVRYSKDGKAVAKQRVKAGKTKATVKGLAPGKKAWVKVRALRKAGGATYRGSLTRAKRPVKVAG